MKFTTTKGTLSGALSDVAHATKSSYGIKAEVSGTTLKVVALDDTLAISRSCTISDGSDGVAVIPFAVFRDMVSVTDGDVTVEVTGTDGTIACTGAEFKFRCLEAQNFPKVSLPGGNAVTMKAAELLQAISQVVPAASTEAARVALGGVLFHPVDGGLRLVATDSYRLAVREVAGAGTPDGKKALVPAAALRALLKVADSDGDVAVKMSDKEIAFATADAVLVSRLIADQYPNYEMLLKLEPKHTLKLATADVNRALERAEKVLSTAASSSSSAVRFSIDQKAGTVTVKTVAAENAATSVIGVTGATADLEFACNPKYLREMVASASAEEVELAINEPLKPMLLSPVGATKSFRAMVMPLKV